VRINGALPQTVAKMGAVQVDEALIEALGEADAGTSAELVAALESVAALLRKAQGDPDSRAGQLARMSAEQQRG
jgi:hypothetical protein